MPPFGGLSGEVVASYAQQLRLLAESVDDSRSRLFGGQHIEWESPAGREFKEYLADQVGTVAMAASYLREAAHALDGYASEVLAAESERGTG